MTEKFKKNLYLVFLLILMIVLIEASEELCKSVFGFVEDFFDWDYNIDLGDWSRLLMTIVVEWTIVTKLFSIGKKFYAKLEKKEKP